MLEAIKRSGKVQLANTWAEGVMAGDDRAAADANAAIQLVVGLAVAGLVAAFLLPVAIEEIVGVDTSTWSSGATSIWNILDLIIVLALLLFLLGLALYRSRGI